MNPRRRRGLTRRELIQGMAGGLAVSAAGIGRTTAAAASSAPPATQSAATRSAATADTWNTIVVGAGVFGAWTAWHLRRAGQRVLLLDASGPANARASSGGESRMTRTIYGATTCTPWPGTRWPTGAGCHRGRPSSSAIGVLIFSASASRSSTRASRRMRRLRLRLDVLDRAELGDLAHAYLRKRFPRPRRTSMVEARMPVREQLERRLLIDRHPRWTSAILVGAAGSATASSMGQPSAVRHRPPDR